MISAIISAANNYLDTLPINTSTKQWALHQLKKRLKMAYKHPQALKYVLTLYNDMELVKDVVDAMLIRKYSTRSRKRYSRKVIHLEF